MNTGLVREDIDLMIDVLASPCADLRRFGREHVLHDYCFKRLKYCRSQIQSALQMESVS